MSPLWMTAVPAGTRRTRPFDCDAGVFAPPDAAARAVLIASTTPPQTFLLALAPPSFALAAAPPLPAAATGSAVAHGKKRPPAPKSLPGSVSERLIVIFVWSVCSPKASRLLPALYLMMKKHSTERGSESFERRASGKCFVAYGIRMRRKVLKISCCDAIGSWLTRTSLVQQPTARGAQPPSRSAAFSASARICAASAGERHGSTCTIVFGVGSPSRTLTAYGTPGGSESRWPISPFGRLMTLTVGEAGAAPLLSGWSTGATAVREDGAEVRQDGMHWSSSRFESSDGFRLGLWARVDATSGSGLTVSGFVCAWRFVWEARPRESGAADVVVEELRR